MDAETSPTRLAVGAFTGRKVDPMKVWWCEVHRSVGTPTICDGLEIVKFFHEPESKCRIVEMQLVPLDDD